MRKVTYNEDKIDLPDGRQLRDLSCFVSLQERAMSWSIQNKKNGMHAYEVLFGGLRVLWIAIVNEHSDIIWVVAITIWRKNS